MKKHFVRLSILFTLSLCSFTVALADHKDYSTRGDKYKILNNIRIDAVSVDFIKTEPIEIFGEVSEVSVFEIRTREVVPFMDHRNPYNNVMKDLDLYYEMVVGRDEKHRIYDSLIKKIVVLCSGTNSAKVVEAGLVMTGDKQLIFDGSYKQPDLVWFDDRFVKVKFKRFSERRRDRIADTATFWKDKIRFYFENRTIPIEKMKSEFPIEFLKLHRDGKFTR